MQITLHLMAVPMVGSSFNVTMTSMQTLGIVVVVFVCIVLPVFIFSVFHCICLICISLYFSFLYFTVFANHSAQGGGANMLGAFSNVTMTGNANSQRYTV